MDLTDLLPFSEAMDSVAGKALLPTSLGSAELRQIEAGIKRLATFSARTDNAWYLQQIANVSNDVLNPRTETRSDGTKFTAGMGKATAELELKKALEKIGYAPDPEDAGTLKDLSSFARRKLVVETNVQLAQGAGHFLQGQDPSVLEAFPAQELVRFSHHKTERDWKERWREAASASGDEDAVRVLNKTGRMVARKDSPIWDALGDSNIFPDALGNPYAPFAFGSGMGTLDVPFAEAEKFGLVDINTRMEPQSLEFADPAVPKEISDQRLRNALMEGLGDFLEFSTEGVLRGKTFNRSTNDECRMTNPGEAALAMIEVLDALGSSDTLKGGHQTGGHQTFLN